MEKLVGESDFEQFFRNWILENRFKSVTTSDFQNFFRKTFGDEKFNSVDWDTWLYKPGYPPVDILTILDTSMAVEARNLASLWIKVSNGEEETPVDRKAFDNLSAEQKAYFLSQILEQMPSGLNTDVLAKMRELYQLQAVQNSEIRKAWLSLALASGDQSCFEQTVAFVSEQGRMKFVR